MFMGGPWRVRGRREQTGPSTSGCGLADGSVHRAQRVGAREPPRSPARRQGRAGPQLYLGDDLGERQPGAHGVLGGTQGLDVVVVTDRQVGHDVGERPRVRRKLGERLRDRLDEVEDRCATGQLDEHGRRDIGWYSVWGLEMTEEEWTNPAVRCVAAVLDARYSKKDGAPSVLLVFNATGEDATFTLPEVPGHEGEWALRIYTGEGHFEEAEARRYAPGAKLELLAHSMALLTQKPQE